MHSESVKHNYHEPFINGTLLATYASVKTKPFAANNA